MKEYPWGKGTPKWTRDATLNDSDKSFTVPTGKVWLVRSVTATIVCTATVGNRILEARITDGADIVAIGPRSGAIAASQKGTYQWMEGGLSTSTSGDLASLVDGTTVNVVRAVATIPSGGYIIPAGYVVQVSDVAAVDAAADDLIVVLHYVEYDA